MFWQSANVLSTSTIDWDSATVTFRVGPKKLPFRVDAGVLREKSKYHFTRLLNDDWDESVEILLPRLEPSEFKIVKDWLYGRQPRWFEHYVSGEGPKEEDDRDAQWTPNDFTPLVDTWKSRYCHHLCRLWVHGSCLGREFQDEVTKRLINITLSDPAAGKRVVTADEPDWTTAFVLDPQTLRLIYDSTDKEFATLRDWASYMVASRLNSQQLDTFAKNDLPNGYISAMYQKKLRLQADMSYVKLENLRRELKYQGEVHE